ncbi:MAG: NADH-quinone oxidoreductase subunit NuoE, partial [Candidatus Aminicenantes bacterium]|nr:NADH-quinone oxidoreductase subunit NuoE [Candidatus Aminicenantes bacterium]
ARYPKKEAALLPVLHLVQREVGFIGQEEERFVAQIMGLKPIKVREVVTFYTMFLRRPIGRYHLQVCSNLSCRLLGAGVWLEYLKERLGIGVGETTADGRFTLSTVECLGACEQAPSMMVNFDYHGHLDKEKIEKILEGLE